MQKRTFERIPAEIKIKFYCDNMDYSGVVTNISENGMFIRTQDMCFPFDSKFEIAILLNEEIFNIPVKVTRITKTNDCYDGIGVELLEPPQGYLKFVDNLRSSL